MKYIILNFTFYLLFLSCQAQIFTSETVERGLLKNQYIITNSNGLFSFSISEDNKLLPIFDNRKRGITVNELNKNDYTLKKSHTFFGGEKKLLVNMFSLFQFQKNNCMVYAELKNEKKIGNVKIALIDNDSLKIKKEMILLDFEKNNISFNEKKLLQNLIPAYKMYMSEGEKKLLLVSEPIKERVGDNKFYFTVIDENFNKIQEREIIFEEDYVSIKNYLCDDDGNIYIHYYGEVDNKSKKEYIEEGSYKIMIISPSVKEKKVLKYKLESDYVTYPTLQYSPIQKKVYLTGSYNKDFYRTGFYYASIDIMSKTISEIKKVDFPSELVKRFEDDGFASTKKKKFGLSDHFVSNKGVVRGDGSIDYILYYSEQINYSEGYPNIYGGDFLDVHLISDKVTFTRIPRNMISSGIESYLNFSTFSKDENLTFLYNDNPKNIELELSKRTKDGVVQKSDVCASTINKDGVLTRQNITSNINLKSIALLSSIDIIESNLFYIQIELLSFTKSSTSKFQYLKVRVN